MIQTHETEERVMLASLPGASDDEQITAGEQVEELMKHPGFGVLAHLLHVRTEVVTNAVTLHKPFENPADYADAIGHRRGLGEVVPLARGVVQNGKEVAQRRRETEESS